jgi:hypothetical protein
MGVAACRACLLARDKVAYQHVECWFVNLHAGGGRSFPGRWPLFFGRERACPRLSPAKASYSSDIVSLLHDLLWQDFTTCYGRNLDAAHSHDRPESSP